MWIIKLKRYYLTSRHRRNHVTYKAERKYNDRNKRTHANKKLFNFINFWNFIK